MTTLRCDAESYGNRNQNVDLRFWMDYSGPIIQTYSIGWAPATTNAQIAKRLRDLADWVESQQNIDAPGGN